jgi:hypothetical protein
MVRARSFSIVILSLALAGCITNNYAVYRHPVTGEVMECEESSTGGGLLMASEKSYYADCKNSLEQRGFERAGTVKRAPTATSISETATPRPAPR